MNIYHYHPDTYEYLGTSEARLDPLETAKTGQEVYLVPAGATTEQPPESELNQIARRIGIGNTWELAPDYRGQDYYDKDTGEKISITKLGVEIPAGCPTQAPPAGMFDPKWVNGMEWIETAIVYQGEKVQSKADVDLITAQRISALGEAKAKTEKLLAGAASCSIWDDFIAARSVILKDGGAFVIAKDLS